MAGEKVLVKKYDNHYGLDLKSSDLTRDTRYASAMLNAQYRKSGAIEKRAGYQAHASASGKHGSFLYSRVNPGTGVEEPQVLSISDKVLTLLQTSITVTYTGLDPTAAINVFFDAEAGVYRAQIQEGTVMVLDEMLGTGYDEVSIYTMDDLNTAIDALPNFISTITGDVNTPAAFIKTVLEFDLVSGPVTLVAKYWSPVNSVASTPLAGSVTHENDDDFENATFAQINNVVYISNGYDAVQKYDGQNVYNAGLPSPSAPTIVLVPGSLTFTNAVTHRVQYIQFDAVGNLIESDVSPQSTQNTPTAEDFQVTVDQIQLASGFNTNAAIVVGNQVATNTITVDDGSGGNHTMKAGDTAYFFDIVSSAYVERIVTAVTPTTITVIGAAVTVNDNQVISNNLRIAIWRSQDVGGGILAWYLVEEIPNNPFTSTVTYLDDTADTALGEQLVEPLTDRGLPPRVRYISSFRNQMIAGGNILDPNSFYFSDVESPEYFPVLNQSPLNTLPGDIITGLAPNNEVFAIFKTRSIHIISGNIADGTIRVDQITNDIGCAAHHSIKEVRGVLFFLSDLGPRRMVGGQVPTALGAAAENEFVSRIDPIFDQAFKTDEEKYVFKRAVAENDRLKEKYLLFLPAESEEAGDKYANAFSAVFAYDYSRDAWLQWDNLNMAGGIITLEDELYWIERRYSDFNTQVDSNLYRRFNNEDAFDYQDNLVPIDFSYSSQWETLGEPSVMKKFLNLRVFSLEELKNNETNLTIKTEHNYVQDDTKSTFMLQFGGGGYGITPYGTTPYGDPSEGAKKHKVNSSRTRSHRVIFENSLPQENVIITGFELEIATPYRPAMKS